METLSKFGIVVWAVFTSFILSALSVSSMPIYWFWLVLAIVVLGLLAMGVRTRRRLVLVNAAAAAVFLGSFLLYWVAMTTAIYSGASTGTRLENMLYVIVGNFQQGQIWGGLRSAYIQLVMPVFQVTALVIALANSRSTKSVQPQ